MLYKKRRFWLSCTISEDERDKLFLLAQKEGKNVSDLLADIVRKYIDENTGEI